MGSHRTVEISEVKEVSSDHRLRRMRKKSTISSFEVWMAWIDRDVHVFELRRTSMNPTGAAWPVMFQCGWLGIEPCGCRDVRHLHHNSFSFKYYLCLKSSRWSLFGTCSRDVLRNVCHGFTLGLGACSQDKVRSSTWQTRAASGWCLTSGTRTCPRPWQVRKP